MRKRGDEQVEEFYSGKKILITGGTGTIGRHLLRRLLEYRPAVVRVLSRDEHKQFEMQHEMGEHRNIRYLIGDVRDEARMARAMEDIDFVFHLAAMKHVPSCEYNPFEAVKTNVIGTQNVIQAAISAGVKKVMFASTDKAISPTNTYGATKLMAERLISAAEFQKGPKQTVFSSVRFGNVMGSRGSVIPLFRKQILENATLTVTDPQMKRYMMTPSQAITLMLKANRMAYGGEVFVLKMPVVRLSDLVAVMKEAVSQKYNLEYSIQVEEIGLRQGEKMVEELMTDDEARIALETKEMYILPALFDAGKRTYPNEMTSGELKITPSDENVISRETLREWLFAEGLI